MISNLTSVKNLLENSDKKNIAELVAQALTFDSVN
jgi:hypothetical protein